MSGSEAPEGFTEWEMVVTRDDYFTESSVFPPNDHEDLQVQVQVEVEPSNDLNSTSSSLSSSDSLDEEEGVGVEGHGEDLQAGSEAPVADDGIGRRLRCRFEVMRAGFFHLAFKVKNFAVSGVGFWSLVSVSGVAVVAVLVSVLCRRVRQWRGQLREERNRRLALLIRDRDEKINRLLLQVARANKLLSARQSVAPIQRQRVPVPVIRVRTV